LNQKGFELSLVTPRIVLGRTVAFIFFLSLLGALASRAEATETLLWQNYGSEPATIGYANLDGSGGGLLNLSGAGSFDTPEGMAYDSVTNRLFVANGAPGLGQITYVNLDGSGAGVFTAPGAPVEEPEGITLDPAARTIYWINTRNDTISWARLDGSAGGLLSTDGAPLTNAWRLAIDPVGGRLYWGDDQIGKTQIGYANLNGSGGGALDTTGAPEPKFVTGLSVDPVAGRLYWNDVASERNLIAFAATSGGNGGTISHDPAPFEEPYGLALDPGAGKLYWGNYDNAEPKAAEQFGFALLSGGAGPITISGVSTDGVQDPLLIKSPSGAGAPTITRNPKVPAELACSSGSWGADYPGSFVYQAPRSLVYQWSINGVVIGAGPERITAAKAGQYTCTVTAANQAGSTAQTSAGVGIKATKVKLSTKKKSKSSPGSRVTFRVKAVNQGDIATRSSIKLCVKLPKAARDDLKAPRCKKLGALKGRAKKTLTIKIKVKPGADLGTDKLTFKVKGAAGKAAKSKIVVK